MADYWSQEFPALSPAGTGLPWHTYELRWMRWNQTTPDVKGLESLTVRLGEPADGKTYALPGAGARAEYSMATPSKGEGARAIALEGSVRVVKQTSSGALLAIDLAARMSRTDVRGEFHESVRGTYWLPARGD